MNTLKLFLLMLVFYGWGCANAKSSKHLKPGSLSVPQKVIEDETSERVSANSVNTTCGDVVLDPYLEVFATISSKALKSAWPTYVPSHQKIILYKEGSSEAFALNFSDVNFRDAKILSHSCLRKDTSTSSSTSLSFHVADLNLAAAPNNLFVFGPYNPKYALIYPDPAEFRRNVYNYLDQAGFKC